MAGTAGRSCTDDEVRAVKISENRKSEPDDLVDHCNESDMLSGYKRPRYYRFVKELPQLSFSSRKSYKPAPQIPFTFHKSRSEFSRNKSKSRSEFSTYFLKSRSGVSKIAPYNNMIRRGNTGGKQDVFNEENRYLACAVA